MTQFIKAMYHTNIQVAEFISDDGRHLLRSGGTLPWRINNGGDLASPLENGKPAPKKTRNFIGFAQVPSKSGGDYHFFIFPDYETGRAELCASLKRKHGERCIPEVIEKYAPSHDNNTEKYTRDLLKATGIAEDKKVKNFTEDELKAMADGIERLEGYHNESDTRKEVWVPVSTIVASDGVRPLADEEIVLKIDGKETTLKSNKVGQFPLIPHTDKGTEVHHKTASGKTQKVGDIQGDTGQHYSLITEVKRFFGLTKPDTAPEGTNQTRRLPLAYQVQPNDSLSKIAAKFNTTIDKIKADNNLRTNKIFPGEILGINGSLPGGTKKLEAAKPQKSVPKAAAESVAAKPKKPPPADIPATQTRSKEGKGAPLALIPTDNGRAPWMAFAVAEAKRFKGLNEDEIEKTTNYATDVGTERKTLIGRSNAWCAAFANWCLMQAGYPIENPTFYDRKAAKGRAHGFYEVKGEKLKKTDKDAPVVRNPLFVQIDKPIFGAIAMVTSSSGHGHHVGFVYGKSDDKHLVLLGGNQGDQINFSPFMLKTKKDYLMFFVPVAYQSRAKQDEKDDGLISSTAEALNKEFGIITNKGRAGETR